MKRSEVLLAVFILLAVVVLLVLFIFEPLGSEYESAQKSKLATATGSIASDTHSLQPLSVKREQETRAVVASNSIEETQGRPHPLPGKTQEPGSEQRQLATIDVWVVTLESQSALRLWIVEVVGLDKPDGGQAKRTNDHGMVRFKVASGVRYDVIASDPNTGQVFSQRTEAVDDSDGEPAHILIEVPVPADLLIAGRVVSASDAVPIIAANISIESLGPSALEPIRLTSDAQGRFEVLLPRSVPFVLTTSAAGLLSNQVLLDESNSAGELLIELSAPAALDVHVRDAAGQIRVGTQVSVWRDRFSYRGNAKEKFGDRPDPWIGVTDFAGALSFEDLPVQVNLQVLVDELDDNGQPELGFPESRPSEQRSTLVVLAAGERRQLELGQPEPGSITGRVQTPEGSAVGGFRLELAEAMTASNDWMLQGTGALRASTVSDANGRFEFASVARRRWWILSKRNLGRSEPQFVDLSLGAGAANLLLIVHNDLFIEGKVLDPSGRGIEAVVYAISSKDQSKVVCDPSGNFRLSSLLPGIYDLYAQIEPPLRVHNEAWAELHDAPEQMFADSIPVQVEAGISGVELFLQPGGQLNVKVVDEFGRAVKGVCWLTSSFGIIGRVNGFEKMPFDNGEILFRGLLPSDEYSLFIDAGDQVALRSRVEVTSGRSTRPLLLQTQPGARLSVRNESQVDRIRYRLLQGAVVVASGTVEPGLSETVSVPRDQIAVQSIALIEGQLLVRAEQLVDCATAEHSSVRLN